MYIFVIAKMTVGSNVSPTPDILKQLFPSIQSLPVILLLLWIQIPPHENICPNLPLCSRDYWGCGDDQGQICKQFKPSSKVEVIS